MRDARYRTLLGWRSSDFFCFVHLAVAVSMQSIKSLAMLRGRLVIGLRRVVVEDDRAFAPVGELDIRRGEVRRADHRLTGADADLVQGALKPLPRGSEP